MSPTTKTEPSDAADKHIEVLDPNFRVSLPSFEGPLDLLLHLIKKHALNIVDLPMAFVVEEYRKYIDMMEELNLDIASEYLLMAATLVHIKSRMLVPSSPSDEENDALVEEELDPRAELVRRLLEYQKYKEAAETLSTRAMVGRDVFVRTAPNPEADEPAALASMNLFALIDAFQEVLKKARGRISLEISAERISIQDRMVQITERLAGKGFVRFEELFEDIMTRSDLVVTFLALLEMAKMHLAQIVQADDCAEIHIRLAVAAAESESVDGSEVLTQDT